MPRTAGELAADLRGLLDHDQHDPIHTHRELLREAAAILAAFGPRPGHHPGCEVEGLYRKFDVTRNDGTDQPGQKHHGCWYFVLDPAHDLPARTALAVYAELVREQGRRPLADDIWQRPELAHNPSPPHPHSLRLTCQAVLRRMGMGL